MRRPGGTTTTPPPPSTPRHATPASRDHPQDLEARPQRRVGGDIADPARIGADEVEPLGLRAPFGRGRPAPREDLLLPVRLDRRDRLLVDVTREELPGLRPFGE